MSVSDPLIKDIKGCILAFLEEVKINRCITDSNAILLLFCQTLEKVFSTGLISKHNKLGFIKHVEAWHWLEKVVYDRDSEISYSYTSCVENVKSCKNVTTNVGKLRLLIRLCLIRKCLHVPIEILKMSKKVNVHYKENSIIGDEILCEIFLSVLRQCSKMTFKLNTSISSFLDISWLIPEVLKLEFVPCDTLGMTVSFTGEKAIVMNLKPNSVACDEGKIEIGDILDTLNGIQICSATKGRLSNILRSCKGQPVVLNVIKAVYSDTRQIYIPIINLLKQVHLDLDVLRSRLKRYDLNIEDEDAKHISKCNSAGYKATYVGYVEVGGRGDVKQIDKAVSCLLSPTISLTCDEGTRCERLRKNIFFELGELGVKSVESSTNTVLLKHSFMEISACGSSSTLPNYFAYIAGDTCCNMAKQFTCYVFFAKQSEIAYTVLQSIGQGFQRTHFAV